MKNIKMNPIEDEIDTCVEENIEKLSPHMITLLNHYNILGPSYNEHSGYGLVKEESVRSLIMQLKYRNLYDYYCYSDPCSQHYMCKHMIIYLKGNNPSYVTFGYNNEVWCSSIRIDTKNSL